MGSDYLIERKLETIGCLIQEVDWLDILYSVHEHHFGTGNRTEFAQSVAMYNVHYLIDLSQLLASTSERTIANYLGWRVVESMIYLIGGSDLIGEHV